ncbi:putative TonB-dependent receptor BfrD [Tepidimonas alkaliphilus]|uniref:Putative TonB-dependent receptor BfrD n=1 Tax=Tepidimonas alkaliphilus TaxID=2588942 RepID=A0A554W9Y5_9BURK|nr:TonB-dependent siderophore receptor [Tepidimonas alkaliphilus]TSE20393.1 putative TonB-dependent receptor BfrD [Tepidimonas alkaliphilus]
MQLESTASFPLRNAPVLPLGAALLAASLHAVAQTQPPAPQAAGTLETVTVTGQQDPAEVRSKSTLKPGTTRLGKGEQSLRDIPQNVTVMTERLLDDRNLDDFRDVLRTTAGITFQAGETGEEDVRLRGFSLGQAGDIYRDGMREGQLITRDTFATDRVEVLKGSASMLFGKGSTGGVVNQVTKQPFLMDRYELEATVGNGHHRRLQADLNRQLGSGAAVRLNAMAQEADLWGAKDDRRGLAVALRTGIGERHEFAIDLYHLETRQRPNYNHPWLLTGNSGETGRRIVPVLPAKNYYGLASNYLNSEQNVLTLSHTWRLSPQEELKTTLRHGRYERDLWATVVSFCQNNATLCPGQTVSLTNPPGPNTILSRNNFKGRRGISDITQLQADYSHKFEAAGWRHHLTAGIDITDEDARRNNNNGGGALPATAPASVRLTRVGTPNDGARRDDTRTWIYNTFDAKSIGVYLQDAVEVAPRWKLVGGVRFDRFEADYRDAASGATGSRRDNVWSPRLGVIFDADAVSSYYASFGQSYNLSGDTYQFALGNFDPGSTNAKLAKTPPEKSRNLEVGAKWELFEQRALVGVALFRSEKYNERNTDPDSAAQQLLLSGKRHATGVEINAAGRITPKWEIFYNHTWIPSAKIDRCNDATCPPNGVVERVGDRPGLTPKHSLSAWTTYRVAPQWRLGLGVNHRSEQSPVGNRTVVAPAFTTLDGMVEYTVDERTTVKLTVNNLTDKLYADGLYRGFYTPGAPRRVFLSLKTVF